MTSTPVVGDLSSNCKAPTDLGSGNKVTVTTVYDFAGEEVRYEHSSGKVLHK